jgi:dolichol-phosphate mannosyltransferase
VELSILLPVRNEGLNLRIMLKILRSVLEVEHEVIVIVDDAQDASVAVTEDVARSYPQCRLVVNDRGRGVLNAIRAGVAAARGRYVLIFAADEVGPVLAIEDMLALMAEGCDFLSATRYAHGGRRLGGSFVGGLLSWLACRMFRLCGGAFTDSTTGIKMFRREVFDRLLLESEPVGWVVAFEMAIKAQLLGLALGEVPIVSIDRLYGGRSTFRLGPWLRAYLRWFVWGARRRGALLRTPRSAVRVRMPGYLKNA